MGNPVSAKSALDIARTALSDAMTQTPATLATWDRGLGMLPSILIDGTSWRWYAPGYVVPAGSTSVPVTATGGGVWVRGAVAGPGPASTVPGPPPTIVPFLTGTAVVVGNLTQYNGALYPVTVAHTYGAAFDAAKHGQGFGAAGLLQGVTGGTNDHAVYLLDDGVTAKDLHVSFIDEIGFKRRLWKDKAGLYWQPGSNITEPAGTGLTPGRVRALAPQTDVIGAGFANYRDIDPKLVTPTDLVQSPNQAYLELGKIYSPTQWQFLDTMAQLVGVVAPASRFDGLLVANYPRNTGAPIARFRTDRFGTYDNASPTYVVAVTASAQNPGGGKVLFQGNGTYKRRFGTDELVGTVPDVQLRYVLDRTGANAEYGLATRLTGAAGTETCVLFTADESTAVNNVKIGVLVAGAYTQLGTGLSVALTGNAAYQWRVETFGTWCGLKLWLFTDPEPAAWSLVAYQNTVNATGYTAVYSSYPTVGVSQFSTVVGRGAAAALTGAT